MRFIHYINSITHLIRHIRRLMVFFIRHDSPPITLCFSCRSHLHFVRTRFTRVPYLLFVVRRVSTGRGKSVHLSFPRVPFPSKVARRFSYDFLGPTLVPSWYNIIMRGVFVFSLPANNLPPTTRRARLSFRFYLGGRWGSDLLSDVHIVVGAEGSSFPSSLTRYEFFHLLFIRHPKVFLSGDIFY